ncbi:MAG: putative O-glycosylation ligase, exosortase system-associated [Massilia sp.]|nr:putative O-glycosylation ligase, exosortase system-associated [Massilia sp.]
MPTPAAWWACLKGCCIVRDAIIFLLFAATIPFIFKRPVMGTLTYAVFSLMNPHRLSYGSAYDFPFAMLIVLLTLISMVMSKEKKGIPPLPLVIVFCIFIAWINFTCLFALEPLLVWTEWSRVMKTMVMIALTVLTVRTVRDVNALVATVALSLGFWGLKSGIFTIKSGGSQGMLGPAGSYITDNNTMALAMVTTVPLLVYLVSQTQGKWLKRGVLFITLMTALAAIGSYSRGAMLASVAMGGFLWLKSRNKAKIGILLALLAPLIYVSMPSDWTSRMHSIDNYQEDASAMGRINAWQFAANIANHYPLGGGFLVFTPRLFKQYAPIPEAFHVAHSIYFQVLGEHGYIGLGIFLLMFLFGWRTGTTVIKYCKDKPELLWAKTLAQMCQVSIIGYLTAGAFLTMAYYDLIYYVLAILVCVQKVVILSPQKDNIPPMRLRFLDRFTGKGKAKPALGRGKPG